MASFKSCCFNVFGATQTKIPKGKVVVFLAGLGAELGRQSG